MNTTKDLVYEALRPRKWVTGRSIEEFAGEGTLRRLRELREEGLEIKGRRIDGQRGYEYRLIKGTLAATRH